MTVTETELKDLLLLKPTVFEDQRGYFFESFNQKNFSKKGLDLNFVQDNQSKSQKNVLRGLHFQMPPFAQGKLIHVIKGAVLDIAVDIRLSSPTYGKHVSIELNEENKFMLYVPPGFAHGFLTLKDDTIFTYKCTEFYNPEAESAILWNDETLDIYWGINDPVLSEKDQNAIVFSQFDSPFE